VRRSVEGDVERSQHSSSGVQAGCWWSVRSERDGAAHYCRRAGGLGRQTVGEKELKHSHAGFVRRITSICEKQMGRGERRRGPSRWVVVEWLVGGGVREPDRLVVVGMDGDQGAASELRSLL
jgi:hypothetical protein